MTDVNTLILGGFGMIGSACVRHCEANGYIFKAPSRKECDVSDPVAVRQYLNLLQPQIVILAVGAVGGIAQNLKTPADFLFENTNFLMNVLPACIDCGVSKFVFFGSSCMYPVEGRQPYEENILLEGKPEKTSMAYAMSKLWGVEACLAVNRQYDHIQCIPVIPNSVYGPNDDFDDASSHVLSALLARFHHAKEHDLAEVEIWGSGSPLREFVFADDVASAVFRLLETEVPRDRCFNIGTDSEISILDLAQLIGSIVGYKGSIVTASHKPDGAPRKLLNCSFLNGIGWAPKTRLDEGLLKTYDWYKSNRS